MFTPRRQSAGSWYSRPSGRWTKTLAALKRAGVRIRGRRGRWAVYIRDPNGYTVELYRDW